MLTVVRVLAFALLSMLAALLLTLSLTAPFLLREEVEKNLEYQAQFQQAAAYAKAYRQQQKRLPDTLALRAWAASRHLGIAPSLWIGPVAIGCDAEDFARAPGDRFVLAFWRGESSECFASPSGRTTLRMSLGAYLASGFGLQLLISLLVGCFLAWCAWRLARRIYLGDPPG